MDEPLFDKPYDEAISVSGDENSTPNESPRPDQAGLGGKSTDFSEGMHASPGKNNSTPNTSEQKNDSNTVNSITGVTGGMPGGGTSSNINPNIPGNMPSMSNQNQNLQNLNPQNPNPNLPHQSSDSDGSSTSSEEDDSSPLTAGQYNPNDYNNLKVSPEVKELFQYITRYRPHSIELETKLKPFIPDFIPAVGEVDAFLKIPRPDGKDDGLGLSKLDEPTTNPSDPAVLDLQMRSVCKTSNVVPVEVRSVKTEKEIKQWVQRIADLHRTTKGHTSNVQYSKKMPDIESLMQVWPENIENYLIQEEHNTTFDISQISDSSMTLKELVQVICVFCDIPYYEGCITESLHVLFSLYLEFQENQHFQGQNSGMMVEGSGPGTY